MSGEQVVTYQNCSSWGYGNGGGPTSPIFADLVDTVGIDGEHPYDYSLNAALDPVTAGTPFIAKSEDVNNVDTGRTVSYTPTVDETLQINVHMFIRSIAGSTLTVTVAWEDADGGAASQVLAPITGALTTTGTKCFTTFLIRADAGTAVTVIVGGIIASVNYDTHVRYLKL